MKPRLLTEKLLKQVVLKKLYCTQFISEQNMLRVLDSYTNNKTNYCNCYSSINEKYPFLDDNGRTFKKVFADNEDTLEYKLDVKDYVFS